MQWDDWLFLGPVGVVVLLLTWESFRRASVQRTDWESFMAQRFPKTPWGGFQWTGTWRILAGALLGIFIGLILAAFIGGRMGEILLRASGGLGVVAGYLWDITTDTSGDAF
jgi:hypothetical protein